MSIFDKWDKNVDTEGLQKDIAEAEANGGQGDYREVPVGTYEVRKMVMILSIMKTLVLFHSSDWIITRNNGQD